MSNAILDVFAVVLVILPVVDWFVARELWISSRRPPRIDALTASAYSSLGIAVAATLGAVLGVNRLVGDFEGDSGPLPPIAVLVGLFAAVVIASLANVPKYRLLREIEGGPVRKHKRGAEAIETPHRRWDDPKR